MVVETRDVEYRTRQSSGGIVPRLAPRVSLRARYNATMTRKLVDIGLNLAHDSFNHDRDAILARALDAGVEYMLITGSSLDSIRAAIELTKKHPERLRATAGIHPHHAAEFVTADRATLQQLLMQPEVIAT
ncbi:MAG TPA: TatD family hydrolase, partial [Roseiflexaceae bacterium]|nr:TatD family hydrolase [Roseiflexaceae bacterium]